MMATATTWQVGVVGAGNMGSGIAQKIAQEGFRVILCDNAEAPLARGMERVRSLLDEGVARGAISPEQRTATTARLTPTVDLAALKDCQLVIEAVFEDLAIKKDLLRSLEQIVAPTAILATNTSSFQVDELANALAHPERFIGLHFFYHPVKNRLVEVVAGPRSELALVKAAWDFMVAIGKTPIATKDTPGFCVNRFFVPWLNEAVRLLDEKVAPLGAIETVAKEAFAIGMGPFELMNVTGVPIAYHAAASLATGLSEFYQPAARLTAQFQSGQTWEITDAAGDQPRALIAERLLAVVWTIACQIVETGIASLEDVDRGAKIGLRWRFGPFELMNRMGIGKALAMVEQLVKQYPALPVPSLLRVQAASGKPWPFRLVDTQRVAAVAHLIINRPEAMNALNGEVLAQLEAAFDSALADPQVRGIVLRGAGKAFVAGADIRFFVKAIENDQIDNVVTFTQRAQALLLKIANSPKPVTAAITGLALGGGAELALTAHRVIATTKGTIGFPETGIGICPALGGTFRTARRVGTGLAKYLLLVGKPFPAPAAYEMGLVDAVVEPFELEETLARVATLPATESSGPRKDYASLTELFAGSPPPILQENFDAPTAEVETILKAIKNRAPIALRCAAELVEKNARLPDEAAYANELASVSSLFSTADALTGLKSVGRERPVFQGR